MAQRLSALENPRTVRVGMWVLSAVAGRLMATSPGEVLEVGQEPTPVAVDLSQRGSQVSEQEIAEAVTGGNGKTFTSITDWLTAKWSELSSTTTNANTGLGNWTSWLTGGSWATVGAAVSDFLSTKSTAATAGTNAATGLGNWTSWLSGGSWANIAASVADFLGTKSTANTAGTNAATAMADASAASSAASAAQTSAQSTIDAGINAIRNTPGVAGQAVEGLAEALASIPTQLFNQFGGNNVPRASQEQANAAMAALVNTVNSQGAAINALQNILSDVGGFSASITFRPAETTIFTGPGTAPWTPPAWAAGGYGEYVIAPAAGGGGAGEGGSGAFGVGGYPGAWATGTFPLEAGAYSIFAGGGGLGGQDEGLGFGDNGSPGDTSTITSPTGTPVATAAGGAGGEGARRGGSGQNGKTISPQTLSAFGEAFTAGSGGTGNAGTGGVAGGGAGGNGGLFGNYTKGGTGGPAKIWMRARPPIPPWAP